MNSWLLCAWLAAAQEPPLPEPTVQVEAPAPAPSPEALAAFDSVAAVLLHPRCANCHPDGDVPTVGDHGAPHAMEITRDSPGVGLPCSTCHRETGLRLEGAPPANPHWAMPPRNQPFEGRTPAQLCAQLNDPETTGGRDLDALVHHVTEDSLVLWGWQPGPGRTPPPIPHEDFVAAMSAWVDAGAPCP